jgi:hypothetical protein
VLILGCDPEDLSILSSCLSPSSLILIQDTQIDSCKEVVGVDTKGLPQFKSGFLISFSIAIKEGQIITEVCVLRVHPNRPFHIPEDFTGTAHQTVDITEVRISHAVEGIDPQSLLKFLNRLYVVSLIGINRPKVRMKNKFIGSQPCGLSKLFDRLCGFLSFRQREADEVVELGAGVVQMNLSERPFCFLINMNPPSLLNPSLSIIVSISGLDLDGLMNLSRGFL